jgi:hypothetical protein
VYTGDKGKGYAVIKELAFSIRILAEARAPKTSREEWFSHGGGWHIHQQGDWMMASRLVATKDGRLHRQTAFPNQDHAARAAAFFAMETQRSGMAAEQNAADPSHYEHAAFMDQLAKTALEVANNGQDYSSYYGRGLSPSRSSDYDPGVRQKIVPDLDSGGGPQKTLGFDEHSWLVHTQPVPDTFTVARGRGWRGFSRKTPTSLGRIVLQNKTIPIDALTAEQRQLISAPGDSATYANKTLLPIVGDPAVHPVYDIYGSMYRTDRAVPALNWHVKGLGFQAKSAKTTHGTYTQKSVNGMVTVSYFPKKNSPSVSTSQTFEDEARARRFAQTHHENIHGQMETEKIRRDTRRLRQYSHKDPDGWVPFRRSGTVQRGYRQVDIKDPADRPEPPISRHLARIQDATDHSPLYAEWMSDNNIQRELRGEEPVQSAIDPVTARTGGATYTYDPRTKKLTYRHPVVGRGTVEGVADLEDAKQAAHQNFMRGEQITAGLHTWADIDEHIANTSPQTEQNPDWQKLPDNFRAGHAYLSFRANGSLGQRDAMLAQHGVDNEAKKHAFDINGGQLRKIVMPYADYYVHPGAGIVMRSNRVGDRQIMKVPGLGGANMNSSNIDDHVDKFAGEFIRQDHRKYAQVLGEL